MSDSPSTPRIYDIAIIGGGINGCGIARDAAGRGLQVFLCEQGDLAQGTSSASTKLIHGGLRYLEHYEFRLVREALNEREILLKNAPHIIWPLRFILPHHQALRPAWLLRLGLFIYDHLGGRQLLPATKTVQFHHTPEGSPLKPLFKKGFEYSDCWVDDARLVALNALDAKNCGADIRTRTRCVSAVRKQDTWHLTLESPLQQGTYTIQARALVNAAGPWVDHFLSQNAASTHALQRNVRLVRGSHIVVPKLYEHDRAYIFQNKDGRIIFTIPYEQNFTLIGTTDQDHGDDLSQISISEAEIHYLCDSASHYFNAAIQRDAVVWTYSGVRPLYNDGATAAQEATRDYVLKISDEQGKAPLLNIFGGKITTYRRLAEDALAKLTAYFPQQTSPWTKVTPLPGGDFPLAHRSALIQQLQQDYPFVDADWAHSLMRRYGKRAWDMLGEAKTREALGTHFGQTLTEREIRFLIETEWVQQANDVLWRRSKLGLHMTATEREAVAQWFQQQTNHLSIMQNN